MKFVNNEKINQIVANTSPTGITYADADGVLVFANTAAQRILGLEQKDSKKDIWTFNDSDWKITDYAGNHFPPENLPFSVVKRTQKCANGIKHAIEWADGRKVLLNINSEPVFENKTVFAGMVSVIEDVTEKVCTEESLIESESRFRLLFENMVSAFALHEIILDSDGNPIDYRFIDVNPAFENFTGLKRQELIGKTVLQVLPGTEPYWIENYGEVALSGKPLSFENFSVELGRHYDIHAFSPKYRQFAVFFTDVTDRVEIEKQLRQSQKMKAMGQLAGGIAHDFNNLLAGIMGFAELASEEVDSKSPVSGYLENIFLASQRAAGLVRQILTFSRPRSETLELQSLLDVVSEVQRFLDVSIPKNITLDLQIEPNLPLVLADSNKVHEALVNLVVNAVKAMEENGDIIVSLASYHCHKPENGRVGVIEPGEYIKLSVQDNGPGIPSKVVERMFEPFFTTRPVGSGTGMGLSVVFGIMQSHKGNILVESSAEQGTIVSLLFPSCGVDDGGSKEVSTSQKQQPPVSGVCVLLVDDDALSLQVAEALLKNLGYEVTSVSSGVEALEIFRTNPGKWRFVVSDQTMPKMTGLELISACRTIRPKLPVLLCSGYSSRISPKVLKEVGVNHLLMKPFTRADMADSIQKVLA